MSSDAEKESTDSSIISFLTLARQESSTARYDRILQNRLNYDVYNLRQDFSYKTKGQSREFLPKMSMAVEQSANFLQQGLAKIGEWFGCEPMPGINEDALKVKPKTVYTLLERQLDKVDFVPKVGEAAKLGLVGSLMIAKVHGKYVNKVKYEAKLNLLKGSFKKRLIKKEDKVWQLDISLVRQEDWYPDPTGRGLYEIQDIYMDYYDLERMAKGPDAIYDLEMVQKLHGTNATSGTDKEYQKARETNMNVAPHLYRKQIKVSEIWGTILDAQGNIMHENVVCTVANDQFIIQKPTPNPYWHGESPYVTCAIVSVPHSVWGRAMMDAPAMLNRASNEMFNLILDGGMMSVHGIKQIRAHYLTDASQIEDGIGPGDTLSVSAACPPGQAVLERVDTATVPQDGLAVLNLLNQEFNASALTNDLRMGVASFRAVKATEVAEASQTISSMFSGMAETIEKLFITKILDKAWKTIAQNVNDLDSDEVKALLGDKVAASLLALGNEELFADTVQGCKFRTFGISEKLGREKDFSKLTGLLQTIGTSETLTEAFMQKYDFSKLLSEIMKALDINTYKIEADRDNGGDLSSHNQLGEAVPQQGGMGQGEMPNAQSQIPQAGAPSNNPNEMMSNAQPPQGAVPQTHFPASRATPRKGA